MDCLLRQLNALLASTCRIASVFSSLNISCIAWTAALQPDSWPAHSREDPAASWIYGPIIWRIAFAIMRRMVSPIPTGRTPGHLSNATSLQAVRDASPAGSTVVVQVCLANSATELHRSEQAFLKEAHKRFHPCESSPDGPAPPLNLRAAIRIHSPSNCSNSTGCGF